MGVGTQEKEVGMLIHDIEVNRLFVILPLSDAGAARRGWRS